MPVTYHFKPFPRPGESHIELASTGPNLNADPCPCQNEASRCSKCKHEERSAFRRPSQVMLSPVKEHPDQAHRKLTPKAIRDRRRASSRTSVASAFETAVGSGDYFTLFPNLNSRADSSPARNRSRGSRRQTSSTTPPLSRGESVEKPCSPLAESVEQANVQQDDSSPDESLVRRGS